MSAPSRKILHVAGYKSCGFFTRALNVLRSAAILFPARLKVIQHEFADRNSFRAWLIEDSDGGFRNNFPSSSPARQHSSSPFVWFGKSADTETPVADDIDSFLGGHDDSLNWCRSFLSPSDVDTDGTEAATESMVDDGQGATDHKYDYDLIVIGGGSGGMASAKEAAALGAKVACMDFVKPSPLRSTTWGLGGTCVNVGCIPKKLFHIGALIRQSIQADTTSYGINIESPTEAERKPMLRAGGANDNIDGDNEMMLKDPETQVKWEALRENIQNYIRGLNFKYRVRLREKNVTYLNKLATFVDKHTIEAVDKKGRSSQLSAARFLIATGGRPQLLSCPGGEHAITSDDVFSLEHNPGKTLCVGASYISLECAGFLQTLGCDVTVAVRSILLRGFDRECADRIGTYMEDHGIKFKKEVTPTLVEKVDAATDGEKKQKLRVTFSDGSIDLYDTVLVAIGRQADTQKLGVDKVGGIETNPKNNKIIGKYEQCTSCPNIYAIGDVLDKTPELTPVAIQAGLLLARRLYGGSKELMDYRNVCTTVFTPIEYACVGLSEDEATEMYGPDNIDVYHREFQPLEWSLSPSRSHSMCYTKAIVDRTTPGGPKVLGIHYVGPNAGEVMQGYGVAMKQKGGLDLLRLQETVGIHPTSSEEIVSLAITKRSGEDAAAGGC